MEQLSTFGSRLSLEQQRNGMRAVFTNIQQVWRTEHDVVPHRYTKQQHQCKQTLEISSHLLSPAPFWSISMQLSPKLKV